MVVLVEWVFEVLDEEEMFNEKFGFLEEKDILYKVCFENV